MPEAVRMLKLARSELILGGQRSGKSRRAELLAQSWLAASAAHNAVIVATAQGLDDEMGQRIARHQADRARRLPRMATVEAPLALAPALERFANPHTLVLVDCLTLWLTNHLMPAPALAAQEPHGVPAHEQAVAALLAALASARGPVVLVSNEIGLGVVPMGPSVRAFVDALGQLNQAVAAACERVTLMAAGLPLVLKEPTCKRE